MGKGRYAEHHSTRKWYLWWLLDDPANWPQWVQLLATSASYSEGRDKQSSNLNHQGVLPSLIQTPGNWSPITAMPITKTITELSTPTLSMWNSRILVKNQDFRSHHHSFTHPGLKWQLLLNTLINLIKIRMPIPQKSLKISKFTKSTKTCRSSVAGVPQASWSFPWSQYARVHCNYLDLQQDIKIDQNSLQITQ